MKRSLYLRRGTTVLGPFTFTKLQEDVQAGSLCESDLLSESKTGPWAEASQIDGLSFPDIGESTENDGENTERGDDVHVPFSFPLEHPDVKDVNKKQELTTKQPTSKPLTPKTPEVDQSAVEESSTTPDHVLSDWFPTVMVFLILIIFFAILAFTVASASNQRMHTLDTVDGINAEPYRDKAKRLDKQARSSIDKAPTDSNDPTNDQTRLAEEQRQIAEMEKEAARKKLAQEKFAREIAAERMAEENEAARERLAHQKFVREKLAREKLAREMLAEGKLDLGPLDLEKPAREIEDDYRAAILDLVPIRNTVGMGLKLIPEGTFRMGTDRKFVTIRKAFYMQTTEVTQAKWELVMGTKPWQEQPKKNLENIMQYPSYPAVFLTWEHAVEFCKKLSARERKTYRLPTEAEWEYACRAGTNTTWSFGNAEEMLEDYAWYKDNANNVGEQYARKVGLLKPNRFGLYDMHGNTSEWCSDRIPNKTGGFDAVMRGGSWATNAYKTTSTYREHVPTNVPSSYYGFRVVRELD